MAGAAGGAPGRAVALGDGFFLTGRQGDGEVLLGLRVGAILPARLLESRFRLGFRLRSRLRARLWSVGGGRGRGRGRGGGRGGNRYSSVHGQGRYACCGVLDLGDGRAQPRRLWSLPRAQPDDGRGVRALPRAACREIVQGRHGQGEDAQPGAAARSGVRQVERDAETYRRPARRVGDWPRPIADWPRRIADWPRRVGDWLGRGGIGRTSEPVRNFV